MIRIVQAFSSLWHRYCGKTKDEKLPCLQQRSHKRLRDETHPSCFPISKMVTLLLLVSSHSVQLVFTQLKIERSITSLSCHFNSSLIFVCTRISLLKWEKPSPLGLIKSINSSPWGYVGLKCWGIFRVQTYLYNPLRLQCIQFYSYIETILVRPRKLHLLNSCGRPLRTPRYLQTS